MKINTIRKIDRNIGPIICRLLLLIRSILWLGGDRGNRSRNKKDYNNIVIIKFFGMGTILLASPAMSALKSRYPDANITILTLSDNAELCRMLPYIDDVISMELSNPFIFLINFCKIIYKMRGGKYDAVIDMEFLTYFSALVTILITMINKSSVAVGFNSPIKWRNKAHNINVSFDHSRHITRIFSKMVSSLGVNPGEIDFNSERDLLIKYSNVKYVRELFDAEKILKDAVYKVCINVNSGDLSTHRRWPIDNFVIVANKLIERNDTAIILIGGPGDVKYVSYFKSKLKNSNRVVDLSGKTDIKMLSAVFSKSSILITNDSGPLHLAYVMGLPTISLFGPETPYLYGPIENDKHRVFYSDLYCSPCLNIYNSKVSHCEDNLCMKLIKPSIVIDEIQKRLI